MCINWKVVGAAAAAGAIVWAVAPAAMGAVFPLLLMAVCPLSMMLMMQRMRTARSEPGSAPAAIDGDSRMANLEDEVHRLRAELRLRDEHASN